MKGIPTFQRSAWSDWSLAPVLALAVALGALGTSTANAQTVSSRTDLRLRIVDQEGDTVAADVPLNAAPAIPDNAQVDTLRVPMWIGQSGLKAGGGSTPALSVEIYKYWLEWKQGSTIPMYLLGELPTVGRQDIDNLTSSLLDAFGGTLNLNVGTNEWRPPVPGGLFSFPQGSPFGLWVQARAGAKLVDVGPGDASTDAANFVALALGTASLKLLLPIWSDEFTRDPTDRAGSIQGEITASLQWSNDQDYREIFSDTALLDKNLFYANANLSLIITNNFYASVAISLHATDARFDRQIVTSLKLMR